MWMWSWIKTLLKCCHYGRSSVTALSALAFSCVILLIFVSQNVLLFRGDETVLKIENGRRRCIQDPAWQDLELFLPVAPTEEGVGELGKYIFPSLALFWPSSTLKLLIVTDAESVKIDEFKSNLQKIPEYPSEKAVVKLNVAALPSTRGWDRQQWLMFWADNFTSAKYVGFLDSDAVFVTKVTSSDLFVDGKPIVRPLFGKPQDPVWWPQVPKATLFSIGLKEPFNCMSYFPVIFRTEHLPKIREHVRRHLGVRTFDEAFARITASLGGYYSQFGIMCAYLWYFERDSYFWVVSEREPGWNGPFVPEQAASYEEAGFRKELLLRQRPHLAVHWNYERFRSYPDATNLVLATGVCFSIPEDDQRRPAYCGNVTRYSQINKFEWTFESHDLSTNRSLDAHKDRLRRIDSCPHDWNKRMIDKLTMPNQI